MVTHIAFQLPCSTPDCGYHRSLLACTHTGFNHPSLGLCKLSPLAVSPSRSCRARWSSWFGNLIWEAVTYCPPRSLTHLLITQPSNFHGSSWHWGCIGVLCVRGHSACTPCPSPAEAGPGQTALLWCAVAPPQAGPGFESTDWLSLLGVLGNPQSRDVHVGLTGASTVY